MNKIGMIFGALAVAVLVTAYSLKQVDTSSTDHNTTESDRHIAWFDGTMEQAFQTAKETDRPVFLYWGAEWCPPCNQLKATIFKSGAFIEKTKLFVPVYLDGDTDRAQKFGEEFGVRGYPTTIILNPDGVEVTRIPGGINLERYVDVLDLSLADIKPVSELVAKIIDDNYQPSADDIRLLAYYSWGQDVGKALSDYDPLMVFRRLSEITGHEMVEERARFDAEYLFDLSQEEEVTGEQAVFAVGLLKKILKDGSASKANMPFLAYDLVDVLEKITEAGDERASIMAMWDVRLAALRQLGSLSSVEQLRLDYGEVLVAKMDEQTPSDDLKNRVRENVMKARIAAKSKPYERIAVTNIGYGLLSESGQNALAEEILKEELADENNAYYWMLSLADLTEESEREDEALEWLRQAYEQAEGQATRIQWGSYYVDGLARMDGDNIELVANVTMRVLNELDAQDEPVYGRNKSVVKRIGRALRKWAEVDNRKVVLTSLEERFAELCTSHFEMTEERAACASLFHETDA